MILLCISEHIPPFLRNVVLDFLAFVLDPLHALEQGEFGKHLWPWLLESVLDYYLAEIDSWCVNQLLLLVPLTML
jgi:hypothetical protein